MLALIVWPRKTSWLDNWLSKTVECGDDKTFVLFSQNSDFSLQDETNNRIEYMIAEIKN